MYNLELNLQQLIHDRLHTSLAEIEAYCRRWQITEFALFGSVLRDDFRPDSDIDLLAVFAPETRITLSDWLDMREEIEKLFGRKVDLVERTSEKR